MNVSELCCSLQCVDLVSQHHMEMESRGRAKDTLLWEVVIMGVTTLALAATGAPMFPHLEPVRTNRGKPCG